MALPATPVKEGRVISLGSLAILERLGNPLAATILGVGDRSFTDSAADLLELLYIHSVNDNDYYDIVRQIGDPTAIRQQAIVWGSEINVNELSTRIRELMIASDLIKGSMVESAKKKATADTGKNG